MIFKSSTVGGLTFHTLLNDQIISKSIELYGEWCFGEIELIARLLTKDANLIELGSNIGSHTVFLAKYTNKGLVYAFEPRRIYFQTLCANLIANGNSNVYAFPLGVADKADMRLEGEVPSNVGINAGGFAIGDLPGSDEQIDLICLDDKIDRLKPISLIKADIEGYELAALKGAQKLIRRDRPLLYLEANDTPEAPKLLRYLSDLGYASWWHTPPYFRTQNRGGMIQNIFGNWRSYNVIACPSDQHKDIAGKIAGLPNVTPIENFDWHPARVNGKA